MHRDCLYKGQGPHEGKRLAHMAQCSRYCCMPNRLTTGCKATIMDLVGKDLEEVDGVWDVAEHGIQAEGTAKAGPKIPVLSRQSM